MSFDSWNPNYVPYVPPAQEAHKGRKGRKGRKRKGKDPEVAKRRAARKALIAQHKAERAARKAERQRIAAARKAAAIVRRQQAAERRAERKRIAEQKRLARIEEAQIRKQRTEERKQIANARKAEREKLAEERRIAQQQKHQLVVEHKIEREKARKLEQERRAARKALTKLRKKTMGGGDTQYRVSIADVNNDLPYIENVDATRLWGVPDGLGGMLPLDGEVVFDDVSDVDLLLKKGKARLEQVSKPQISYEANVVSLGKTGFSADAVGVGDAVQIVDTTFNPPIRVEGRVLKIEEDLLGSPDSTHITLGSMQETLSQRREAEKQKLDNLISQSSEWNTAASNDGVYVRDLIARLNDILNARGGYTYFTPDEGIFVYDKSEDAHPTNAIQIGGGFWRIADSLKPNGDWDWKNVCDGHGLFANRIYTGILSDAVGKNFWNLDTGEFSLQAATKIGGKTVQQIADDSAKDAAEVLRARLDSELTQRAIFNKLTNNGSAQGMWLNGGQLYVNANYLSAGIISDRYGRNEWNLDTGYLRTKRGEIGDFTLENGNLASDYVELNSRSLSFYDGSRHRICSLQSGCENTGSSGGNVYGMFFKLESNEQYFDIRTPTTVLANGDTSGWSFYGRTSLDSLWVTGNVTLGNEAIFDCNHISCTGEISCGWLDEKFNNTTSYFNERANDLQAQINDLIRDLNNMQRG